MVLQRSVLRTELKPESRGQGRRSKKGVLGTIETLANNYIMVSTGQAVSAQKMYVE